MTSNETSPSRPGGEPDADASAPVAAVGPEIAGRDDVSVARWFLLYGACLLAAAVPLALMISHESWTWHQWWHETMQTLAATDTVVKLLAFAVYISLCCTFLPLPTGWIVSAIAMKDAAVGPDIWTTTLAVAAVGALGSTFANLNDYHLFTLVLRSRRVAKIRETKLYHVSARWFARSPFYLVTLFNVLPIPVDVVRMLASVQRYPRLPFAAANFIGRFVRYGVIAWVTYRLGEQGKWVVVGLLGIAVVLAAAKVLPTAVRRMRPTTNSADN